MLAKLSVDQALMKARSHAKKDEIAEAEKHLSKSHAQGYPKKF